jgi:pantoate--beta-alanine ligase
MGALHAGHISLIGRALAHRPSRPVVVSVFVNPTQFGPNEDFAHYPRTFDADVDACSRAGAAAVFAPDIGTVYPPSGVPVPPLPAVATEPLLEDAARPGHFAGVCQVVARLFDLVKPSAAVFGEKDWQQLQVIRAMTLAARLPIEIIPSPIVRDPDGLAMSSRNRFLSPQDRGLGLSIIGAIREAELSSDARRAEDVLQDRLARAGIRPDYAVVRDALTLQSPRPDGHDNRILVAARIGPVRLLDNGPARPKILPSPHNRCGE